MVCKFLIHHLSFTRLQMPSARLATTGTVGQALADGGQVIRKSVGFTLIELMVAISITAVLGTLGIAGFVNYNQSQVLQTSVNEVATMLNLAKSRAQSQVKLGASCSAPSQTLEGYGVNISTESNSYTLSSSCSGVPSTLDTKTLPQNVSFTSPTTTSFFFPVQKGGVNASGQIVISSSGKTKTITINPLGGVSVQ